MDWKGRKEVKKNPPFFLFLFFSKRGFNGGNTGVRTRLGACGGRWIITAMARADLVETWLRASRRAPKKKSCLLRSPAPKTSGKFCGKGEKQNHLSQGHMHAHTTRLGPQTRPRERRVTGRVWRISAGDEERGKAKGEEQEAAGELFEGEVWRGLLHPLCKGDQLLAPEGKAKHTWLK